MKPLLRYIIVFATFTASAPAPADHHPDPAMALQQQLNTAHKIIASQAAHMDPLFAHGRDSSHRERALAKTMRLEAALGTDWAHSTRMKALKKLDQSLLYVSKSLVDIVNAYKDVGDIVEVALARNTELKVTGALIYTGSEFAQILEGTEDALAELMASIYRDKRHTNVTVVYQEPINERRFSKWAMAYAGRATFVSSHVRPLLVRHDADKSEGIKQLITIMEEFVRDDK